MERKLYPLVDAYGEPSACQLPGTPGDTQARNLAWLDCVGAESSGEACMSRPPDRVFFVYSGDRNTHGANYTIHVLLQKGLGPISTRIRRYQALLTSAEMTNLLAPFLSLWVNLMIELQTWSNLKSVFREAYVDAFKTVGLFLPCKKFFWVVADFLAGRFYAAASPHPSKRHKFLKLPMIAPKNERAAPVLKREVPTGKFGEGAIRQDGDDNV